MILALFLACLLPLATLLWASSFFYSSFSADFVSPPAWHWGFSFLAPVAVAVHGLRRKRIDQSGAAMGLIVGFLLTISCLRFFASLLAFFISASKATVYRSDLKKKIEADFKEGGQRNWVQVVSNAGPASVFAIFYMWEVGSVDLPVNFGKLYSASWYAIAVMSALACASGDTFASSIGLVSGNKNPIHILKLTRVPRGTNGGVSLIGTLSSLFGGLVVGVAFYIVELLVLQSGDLLGAPAQWPVILYGGLAGFLGSLVDSLLGGALQFSGKHPKLDYVVERPGPGVQHISGVDILDNHSVNLLASLLTGLAVPYVAAQTWISFS
ncbi:transmembrane protein 19 [Plakobranchus ocellatus]|uniref:Transmembrane protein 19 n=1 Tax=Plakobranchus ocellatus TaxID=259542 RepID=A0AAV4AVI6_9GAST|nr:transmembrane protein 19 [Plakobranchus ocellatus]